MFIFDAAISLYGFAADMLRAHAVAMFTRDAIRYLLFISMRYAMILLPCLMLLTPRAQRDAFAMPCYIFAITPLRHMP